MNTRLYILPLLMIISSISGFGQKDELLEMAIAHFGTDNQQKTWWLKDFTGYLDYAHEVRMVIATDNEIYKGAYELKSSGLRFYIDGHLEDEDIHFVETDINGRTTGYISGQLNEDKFYCTWSDIKNIEQLDLYLYDLNTSSSLENYLGWLEFYRAVNVNDVANTFTLQYKEGVYSLYAGGRKVLMECNDDACATLSNISAFRENTDEIFLDRIHRSVSIKTIHNEEKINLKIANKIQFTTQSFMDFDERVSAVYPKNDNQKFNAWSQLFFMNLFNKETFEFITKTKNDAISERCKHQYVGDILVDLATDSIFSGLYFVQSSAKTTVAETPFCYDLKKNKVIDLKEALILDDKWDSFLKAKANELMKDGEPVKKSNFSLFTLCDLGLKCRSPFNTITGREELIIPYTELKPFIQKKGGLAKYGNK